MEDYVLFSICTAWRSAHKWAVNEEGLIDFHGSMITPSEALERFLIEYPMFRVLRADIWKRTSVSNGRFSYTWTEIERLL
jgi:hypothetical protein